MSTITIEGLTKRYGENTIIDSMDLSIAHGEFFTLLGPSGCGKTTLLRMIAGFIRPDAGRLLLGDEDITHLPAHQRGTGMVFQDYALFPDKTVFDNVAYGLRVRRVSRADIRSRVGAMLERMGLGHLPQRYPGEISGGQRQRVALARALIIEPRVLLMDEPLSNLDAKLRIQMRDVIRQLQQELQMTAVFVTHDQEEALSMSDRIALLRSGRIDQLDTPSGLYQRPQTAYAADFIGAANLVPVTGHRANDDGTRVDIPGGSVALDEVPPAGDKMVLVARPEHISVHMQPQDGSVPARVLSRRYLGVKASYTLQLADEFELQADVPTAQDLQLEPGSPVHLLFSPACRLVAA